MSSLSITCPRCGLISHHPKDIEQGYCGSCHWWTSDRMLGRLVLDGQHHRGCRRPQCIGCMVDQDATLPSIPMGAEDATTDTSWPRQH